MSSNQTPAPKELIDAFNAYKVTEDYQNTRKWALHDEHVDGSLWAAWLAGRASAAPSPATAEAEGAEIQSAVNLVCNHLNEHSRELGGAGMIAEAQDYAHAAALVRRHFGEMGDLPYMPTTDAAKPTEHMVDEALDGFNTMPATEGLRAQVEHGTNITIAEESTV